MNAGGLHPIRAGGLPIFRRDDPRRSLFYAPGFLVVAAPRAAEALAAALAAPPPGDAAPPASGVAARGPGPGMVGPGLAPGTAVPGPASGAVGSGSVSGAAAGLRRWAADAQRAREAQASGSFRPLCLTLYLHNECNLACRYCFAEAGPDARPRLDLAEIRAAARLVVANCRAAARPLTLVCHGGGEPALHPDLLADALDDVERIAAAVGLPLFRYIATNGALAGATAAWVARRFDLVGLSCDGPPDVQDAQRPRWGGGGSAPLVERTARIVREAGKPLHVRVTVTHETLARQAEIADYICRVLRPAEIHVEAVYAAGRAAALAAVYADPFVQGFLAARQVAAGYGVRWINSGSRPGEIHGSYCHVFRDVLNLVPGAGGAATGCFLVTDAGVAAQRGLDIGRQEGDDYIIDPARVAALRGILLALPEVCDACFNRYHCARSCPDACPLDGLPPVDGFLCRVRRQLAEAEIDTLADRLCGELAATGDEWAARVLR